MSAGGPVGDTADATEVRRILALMREEGAYARLKGGECVVIGRLGSVSVRKGAFPATLAGALVRRGVLAWQGRGDAQRLVLRTEITQALPEPADLGRRAGPERPVVNPAESPLAWLRGRRERSGEPLLDEAAFAAGERLRQDITVAGLLPRVTADWSMAVRGTAAGLHPAEAVVAARQRVRRAFDAVGPEFAGLLLDVCGFLKGLELVERERRWPLRSAKIVLRLALAALARHYGLAAQARGPERAGAIRAWQQSEPFSPPPGPRPT